MDLFPSAILLFCQNLANSRIAESWIRGSRPNFVRTGYANEVGQNGLLVAQPYYRGILGHRSVIRRSFFFPSTPLIPSSSPTRKLWLRR